MGLMFARRRRSGGLRAASINHPSRMSSQDPITRGSRPARLRDDNRGDALTAVILYPATLILTLVLIQTGYTVSAALVIRSAVANAVTLRSVGVPLAEAQFAALEIAASSGVIASLEWCAADGTWGGPGGSETCWPPTEDNPASQPGSVIMAARARPVQVAPWAPRVVAVDTAWLYADT